MSLVRHAYSMSVKSGHAWVMNHVSDQLVDRRRVRALMIVDVYSHEALMTEVGHWLKAENLVVNCKRLVACRGASECLFGQEERDFGTADVSLGLASLDAA